MRDGLVARRSPRRLGVRKSIVGLLTVAALMLSFAPSALAQDQGEVDQFEIVLSDNPNQRSKISFEFDEPISAEEAEKFEPSSFQLRRWSLRMRNRRLRRLVVMIVLIV